MKTRNIQGSWELVQLLNLLGVFLRRRCLPGWFLRLYSRYNCGPLSRPGNQNVYLPFYPSSPLVPIRCPHNYRCRLSSWRCRPRWLEPWKPRPVGCRNLQRWLLLYQISTCGANQVNLLVYQDKHKMRRHELQNKKFAIKQMTDTE